MMLLRREQLLQAGAGGIEWEVAGGLPKRGLGIDTGHNARCFCLSGDKFGQGGIEPVDSCELPGEDIGLDWKHLSRARPLQGPSGGRVGWAWAGESGGRGTTYDCRVAEVWVSTWSGGGRGGQGPSVGRGWGNSRT